jgi:hypothetical protein
MDAATRVHDKHRGATCPASPPIVLLLVLNSASLAAELAEGVGVGAVRIDERGAVADGERQQVGALLTMPRSQLFLQLGVPATNQAGRPARRKKLAPENRGFLILFA